MIYISRKLRLHENTPNSNTKNTRVLLNISDLRNRILILFVQINEISQKT